MTTKEYWDHYCKNNKSPQLFLDLAFYWMMGAALQRRVWMGNHLKPIIPSLYVILCGPPGTGKGLCITEISSLMSTHKFKPVSKSSSQVDAMLEKLSKDGASIETLELLRQSKEAMKDIEALNRSEIREDPLLFPMGADSTTFESIVQQHAKAVRTFHVGAPCAMAPSGLYTYHSINFIVEEAAALFNKHSEKIVHYLLSAYNCDNYVYRTKHFGAEVIQRCSLAFLAGTNPEFMSQAFDSSLLGEGFSARTIFVYSSSPRFENWRIPELDNSQLAARQKLLTRLMELSKLFGQVKMNNEAIRYMDDIYLGKMMKIKKNKDPRLGPYYARHALHVQKLAMCIHFADSNELEIQQPAFEQAIDLLEKCEHTMHLALSLRGRNPVGDLQRKILRWLESEGGPKTFVEIYVHFVDDANEQMLEEALNYLLFAGKIDKDGLIYTVNKKTD